jgi:hypothetical protein
MEDAVAHTDDFVTVRARFRSDDADYSAHDR